MAEKLFAGFDFSFCFTEALLEFWLIWLNRSKAIPLFLEFDQLLNRSAFFFDAFGKLQVQSFHLQLHSNALG